MQFKDYYAVMGLARDATQDDVKRAYRKLARKYHPDVSKESDAEARFKEVGEAYEVLKDPEKRAAYDQLGPNWRAGQEFDAPPGWDDGFEFSGAGFAGDGAAGFSDFFESLFGQAVHGAAGAGPAAYAGRQRDHHAKIVIDLEDVWHSTERTFTLRTPAVDEQGHVVLQERTLRVRIPKGVTEGQHIRLAGQGTAASGRTPAGDLYLEVAFKAHPLYKVDGRDLYLELPVAPWEAALGATVKVPTLAGTVEMKVPQGSSAGRRLRLKGRGIPGSPAGDLYAILQIALPPADTDKARAFYRNMQESFAFDPRSTMGV
ncbi:MAG: DnaJ C-terminal domain-containing protein [Gammaproteobacteria bacterium]